MRSRNGGCAVIVCTMVTQLTVPPTVVRASLHAPPPRKRNPLPRAHDADTPGAWRYVPTGRPPRIPLLAMTLAGSVHALLLFGLNQEQVEEKVVFEDTLEEVVLVMPELEDLEEPEIVESDGPREEVEAAAYVPMLADVPSATIDTTFVQKMDFSTLAPKPDIETAKVINIPRGPRTGGVRPDSMTNIFNLADLDRVPEPVFQPPPVFPRQLRNEVSKATVTVEFIVSADGKVTYAKVTDASYPGFEDAAIRGVMRWQFRPGMKGGKRVATRMIVPLIFRVVED